MNTSYSYIDENLSQINKRIKTAAEKANAKDPNVVAAVKYASKEEIEYLTTKTWIRDVGENRVQQLLEHLPSIDTEKVNIHFIGRLQTNKVKYIIDKVSMIHSLDSEKLAAEIDRQAKKHNLVMDVLVEINCGREEGKGGVMPEKALEFCLNLKKFTSIRLRGFMTMAPKCEKNEEYLQYFAETYKLILDIWQKIVHNNIEPVVSMGMSESFEQAILCGSNCIRIGRSIFEKRKI